MEEDVTLTFPTRLTLERWLTSFTECFLGYVPCIHIATWTAESSHCYLLLAMASIGAALHEEHTVSDVLRLTSKRGIMDYVRWKVPGWYHMILMNDSWTMHRPRI